MKADAIKDKVAIIGMGTTRFGENWNLSVEDMLIDAVYEAYADAGVEPKDIEAAWIGSVVSAFTGATLAIPLKMKHMPITRVENACSTGMDALRNACFGVACGLYDIVLVAGVEKLKDSGYAGLPEFASHVYGQGFTAPGRWAMIANKYFQNRGITPEEGKRALAKIAVKNHYNGTFSPKAHFQKEIDLDRAINSPIIAWPLGLFDCCPTTDGAAAAIICSEKIAKSFKDDYVLVKGFGVAIGDCLGKENIDYKYDYLPETEAAARQAYEAVGIKNPRKEIHVAQIHDCFTIAELTEYEALGFCEKGTAVQEIEAGTFTLQGELPINTDGGLKAFGHPLGATGLRMCNEIYLQLRGKAGPRQIKNNPTMGLAMAQGGHPGMLMPIITMLGTRD
ncbi:MAG: acetyl-CoA acetyltransferase [Pseudomonadota bacterium]